LLKLFFVSSYNIYSRDSIKSFLLQIDFLGVEKNLSYNFKTKGFDKLSEGQRRQTPYYNYADN